MFTLYLFYSNLFQVIVDAVVPFRFAGLVGRNAMVALGDADDHTLASSGEQHAIGVDLVLPKAMRHL